MIATSPTLLRQRGRQDSGRVSMIELFFDLVCVFAVTQLSHLLLALLVPALAHWFSALALGAMTTGILMLVAAWESVALRRP